MNTDSTDQVVPRVVNPREKDVSASLVCATERLQLNQGIDSSAIMGVDVHRRIMSVMTPSGTKDAILMTDGIEDIMIRESDSHGYMPHYPLPEPGVCWSGRQITVDGAGVFAPTFSPRTLRQMSFVEFYHSACLVRLVCKTPLVSAQSFWVSRNFSGTADQNTNVLGFTWVPSRQSEIFVLMPWADFNFSAPVTGPFSDSFGFLSVQPLSDLITEVGTAAQLEVSAFFSPYQMTLYNPLPISEESALSTTTQSITATANPTSFDLTVNYPIVLGVSGFQMSPWAYAPTNAITISSLGYNAAIQAAAINIVQSPVFLTPGLYTVDVNFTSDTTTTFRFFGVSSTTGESFTIAPSVALKEIQAAYEVALSDKSVFFKPSLFNQIVIFDDEISDNISRLSAGFKNSGYSQNFFSKVISQDPSIVRADLVLDGTVVAHTEDASFTLAKHKLAKVYFEEIPLRHGVLEMFEFKYEQQSKAAERAFGVQGDNVIREDSHWLQFDLDSIASPAPTVLSVTLDLSALNSSPPYPTVLREYSRHLLKSKYPNIKIQAVKNPYSNLLLRVTNGVQTSLTESLQLPGIEWDPSQGDLEFQPYWNQQTPGVTDMIVSFSVSILSSSVSDSGLQLVYFVNTAPLEFYHYKDYDTPLPTLTKKERRTLSFPEGSLQISEETPIEEETNTTVAVEATSVISPPIRETLTIGHPPTERKYHYCGGFLMNLSTLKFVVIPLSHTNFPKYEVNTAKRYRQYFGSLWSKLTMNTNVTLAGIIYAVQVDAGLNYAALAPRDLIRMYPSGKQLVQGGSVEIPLNWRQSTPFLPVSYETTAPTSQLGDLVIILPNASTTTTGDPSAHFVLEMDTSNLKYRAPSLLYPDYSYSGLRVFNHTRA